MTRFPLKNVVVEQVESDKVYLTEDKIQKLYALKYLSNTKKENEISTVLDTFYKKKYFSEKYFWLTTDQ